MNVDRQITIRYGRLLAALALFLGLLVLMDLTTNLWFRADTGAIRHMWNLAREDAIGTWVSVVLLLATGLTMIAVGSTSPPGGRRGLRFKLLGALFCYMSFDDGSKIHERVGSIAKAFAGEDLASRLPSYSWQFVYAPVFGGMALLILYIVLRDVDFRRSRVLLLSTLACYMLSVGIDFFEGMIKYTFVGDPVVEQALNAYKFKHPLKVTEEILEMFGTCCSLVAGLEILARNRRSLTFRFSDRPPAGR